MTWMALMLAVVTAPTAASAGGIATVVRAETGFAGVEHMVLCPDVDTGCPQLQAAGGAAAALSLGMLRARGSVRGGARLDLTLVHSPEATGAQLTPVGLVRFDRTLIAELGVGPSLLWLGNRGRSATDVGWSAALGLGVRVADSWAVVARGSLVDSFGEMGLMGGFLGVGVEWQP